MTTERGILSVPIAWGSPHWHALKADLHAGIKALATVDILLPAEPASGEISCHDPGPVVWRVSPEWLERAGLTPQPGTYLVVCRHQIEID